MGNIKLPNTWVKKSQELYPLKHDEKIIDIQSQFVFVNGAQSMLTAVANYIQKEMKAINEKCNKETNANRQATFAAQWNVLEELLEELKSIQP